MAWRKKPKTIAQFLLPVLRKHSVYWHGRQEAMRKAKLDNSYLCASCKKFFGKQFVQLDHIVPVGTPDNWDRYIKALYCDASGYQVLCVKCHLAKTNADALRARA